MNISTNLILYFRLAGARNALPVKPSLAGCALPARAKNVARKDIAVNTLNCWQLEADPKENATSAIGLFLPMVHCHIMRPNPAVGG